MRGEKAFQSLLSATIADEISKMIIENKMEPRVKASERKGVAESYRVSRPTIREAMRALKAKNVVVIRQGRHLCQRPHGAGRGSLGCRYVEQTTLTKGIFEARLLIEPRSPMHAAERRTESELREMGAIVEKMQATDSKDPARSALDHQFHTLIAKCSRNPVFNQLMPRSTKP
jgi:DNA-binding FadR family transcriptional regulator